MAATMRTFVGTMLIKAGMAILPPEVRKMVRKVLMYHVPGALSEDEKREIRIAKSRYENAVR